MDNHSVGGNPPGGRLPLDSHAQAYQDIGGVELLDESGKKALWSEILAQIQNLHPVKIYPYIKEGRFISIDNEELIIGFPKIFNYHRNRLEDVGLKAELSRIVTDASGLKVSIAFVTISEDQPGNMTRDFPDNSVFPSVDFSGDKDQSHQADSVGNNNGGKSAIRDKVMMDDRVKKMLEVFEGRLLDARKS